MKARENSLAREIRNYYFLLLVVSIMLTALFILVVATKGFEASIKESIKGEATFISSLIDSANLNINSISDQKSGSNTSRITVIDNKGNVIYDNKADISTLDNHSDREEVLGAISSGEDARSEERLGGKEGTGG